MVHDGWDKRGQGKEFKAIHNDNPVMLAVKAKRAAVPAGTPYTVPYAVATEEGAQTKDIDCLNRVMDCKELTAAEIRRAKRETDAQWVNRRTPWLPNLPEDWDDLRCLFSIWPFGGT